MDVHCSSCGEPWDVYHLRHDAIFETDISHKEAEAWRSLSAKQRLSPRYREMFTAVGYEFGASLFDVRHCPACSPSAIPDPEKVAMKTVITEILGDDEDGIAATMEDFGL